MMKMKHKQAPNRAHRSKRRHANNWMRFFNVGASPHTTTRYDYQRKEYLFEYVPKHRREAEGHTSWESWRQGTRIAIMVNGIKKYISANMDAKRLKDIMAKREAANHAALEYAKKKQAFMRQQKKAEKEARV